MLRLAQPSPSLLLTHQRINLRSYKQDASRLKLSTDPDSGRASREVSLPSLPSTRTTLVSILLIRLRMREAY